MSWSSIDINNPPANGTLRTGGTFLPMSDAEKPSSMSVFPVSSYKIAAPLEVYTDPQPWGFVGPRVIIPVIGTVITDCLQAGCDTGGGGSVRPSTGFMYPRRV